MSALDRLRTALADRYTIERELGQGGMATVYLAHDIKHDRDVAIKVLRPELAAAIGAERFLAEIKTTAGLHHPHILQLFDSGEADGLLYFVMPVVEGESLRERITREQRLPIADAVRIASDVASALDHAHRHGVVHRDIKPENILLQDGQALVADFGIAIDQVTAGSRLTGTGISIGTPQYMSPEQALGERVLDARTDIYALGVTLYEALTGTTPFTGPTAQAIVAKVITEKPAPPSRRRREIPAYIDRAVMTAIEKAPERRFETAAAFRVALMESALAPARPRWWPAAAIAIGLSGIAAAVMLTTRPNQAAQPIRSHVPDSAATRLVADAADLVLRRQDCARAVEEYSDAAFRDSLYTEAFAGLAMARATCALFGTQNPRSEFQAAANAADKAISLDPRATTAYIARGMARLFNDQDWDGAEQEFNRASAIDSTRFEPWLFRVWVHLARGEIDSAIGSIGRAKQLAPVAAIVGVRMATVYRLDGRFDAADRALSEVLERDSLQELARAERVDLELARGQCGEALAAADWLDRHRSLQSPKITDQYTRGVVAATWAMCGRRAAAVGVADSLERVGANHGYVDPLAIAMVYGSLARPEDMYRWLDRAVEGHNWGLFFLKYLSMFAPYRDDPRFLELAQRAHLN
ncbi:MAG: protein kinase [Gemmatimonadota bacterium]